MDARETTYCCSSKCAPTLAHFGHSTAVALQALKYEYFKAGQKLGVPVSVVPAQTALAANDELKLDDDLMKELMNIATPSGSASSDTRLVVSGKSMRRTGKV